LTVGEVKRLAAQGHDHHGGCLTSARARELDASIEAEIAAAYERGKAEGASSPEERGLLVAVIRQMSLLTDEELQAEPASDLEVVAIAHAELTRRWAVREKGSSV
jgi:hypothetical protein